MMLKKILLTAAMLAAITNVHAAATAPFGVTGTITPAPCNVVMTTGVASVGATNTAVRAYTIFANTYTAPPVTIPITISCSTGIKVALSFVDNLAGKNFPLDASDAIRFGIVDGSGTAAIGAYQMQLTGVTLDGSAVNQFMIAQNGSTAWAVAGPTSKPSSYGAPGYSVTFSKTNGSTTPDSFANFSGNLTLQAYLSTTYINAANSVINPTGSGTLAMVYL